jgi:putative methionine-R-sulfoxide reductase with GAF domain
MSLAFLGQTSLQHTAGRVAKSIRNHVTQHSKSTNVRITDTKERKKYINCLAQAIMSMPSMAERGIPS